MLILTEFSLKNKASSPVFSSVSELCFLSAAFNVDIFSRTLSNSLWPMNKLHYTLHEVDLDRIPKNIVPDQVDEIVDLPAFHVVLIGERVQSGRTVYVHIFAYAVIL